MAERRYVVEYPERASVSGRYQIVAMNGKIANGADGEIELKRWRVVFGVIGGGWVEVGKVGEKVVGEVGRESR